MVRARSLYSHLSTWRYPALSACFTPATHDGPLFRYTPSPSRGIRPPSLSFSLESNRRAAVMLREWRWFLAKRAGPRTENRRDAGNLVLLSSPVTRHDSVGHPGLYSSSNADTGRA